MVVFAGEEGEGGGGGKFLVTQVVRAGCSSLRKMPRYLTLGLFWCLGRVAGEMWMVGWCAVGASAQKYQGETPICSDRS